MREPAHGLRERGRAIARRRSLFADFGYPVTIMLAHIVAWAVDGADFRLSRSGSGSGLAAAHGLRECRRAIARRRGLFADFGDSVFSHLKLTCMHARMQISSLTLMMTLRNSYRRSGSKGCCEGLPMNVEHVHYPLHALTRSCNLTTRNEIPPRGTNLDPWHEETRRRFREAIRTTVE